MLQARLKELERGRAAATTPKSADLEDTILGPLGRRLDAEEKGEGPSSTVELFRVEAPDAPGTVGPAAHEFTTFDDYAGQPPPPPPPGRRHPRGVRVALARRRRQVLRRRLRRRRGSAGHAHGVPGGRAAAARRAGPGLGRPDAVGNPADVLNAALVSGQPESPPAVPTPAGIAASTRPSPVADVGGRPRPAARAAARLRGPARRGAAAGPRAAVAAAVAARARAVADPVRRGRRRRAATISKVPPGAAVSPPRVRRRRLHRHR